MGVQRGGGSRHGRGAAGRRGDDGELRSLPADFRLHLDGGLRRVDGGTVLIGGSPLRILRLTAAGAAVVDRLATGAPVGAGPGRQALARRLLDAGMAHPDPPAGGFAIADVAVVVPVRDERVPEVPAGVASIVVVDDGSVVPVHAGAGSDAGSLTVLRHGSPRGPAAARNTGWRATSAPLVAFLDADCTAEPGWLESLLPHFADPAVGAVAPRVSARAVPDLWGPVQRYELARSPLDRGRAEAIVRPKSTVPYVPATALVVRREALEAAGGFDEELRFGEDVDLVWRLVAAGWTVRYAPAISVTHPTRASVGAWVRQRVDYGTSAAPLAARHGATVAPLAVSGWSAAAWALAAGWSVPLGAAVAAASTALLGPRLRVLAHPWREAFGLAGRGHLLAGLRIAEAARRAWWPVLFPVGLASRRGRRVLLAAAVGAPLVEWARQRPDIDPVTWVSAGLADDLAYGAGVWIGCLRERSGRALVPDLANWPGRRAAVDDL